EAGEPCERVVVGSTSVDHDRLAELGPELELRGEEAALILARGVVAIPVEPGLADRNCFRMPEQIAELGELVLGGQPRFVWVDAEDREDAVVPLGEREGSTAVVDVCADCEDPRDASLGCALDRL